MRRLALVAIALFVLPSSGAFASPESAKKLAIVIEAMKADDWPAAKRVIAQTQNESARIYADWRRLRAGEGKWGEYVAFAQDHSDWPGLPLLRKVGETKIPVGRPHTEILKYFKADLPQTGRGALRLAEALEQTGQKTAAENAVKLAWLTINLTESERKAIYSRYKGALKGLHMKRADHLIWTGQFGQAVALKGYLSNGQAKLVDTRVALRRNKNGVNKLIDGLSSELQKDPGLAYDRFRWRLRRDLWDSAGELLLTQSTSRENLGRPEIWSDRRRMVARRLMRARDYETAYKIASNHHLQAEEAGFIDLEWLSGYLKLVYLKDPETAVSHFRRLRETAVTPITSGRVWYWLGRAHEANDNLDKAVEAYQIAARYQTSFYGQMATQRAKFPPDTSMSGDPKRSLGEAQFQNSTVFRAGQLLQLAGEHYEAGRFFAHLAEDLSQEDQARLGDYLNGLKEPNMALRVAKNAARQGRVNINSYYPVTDLTKLAKEVPPEFVMAIARQESELNQNVESPVGAQGMMQVMPATAKQVAKDLGMDYSFDKLRTDWQYNAALGVGYLAEMLDRYDGSFVLAAAAYNAGPHRADRWIRENGDPRSPDVNTEQWIEKIQFRETRNYVQRVLESTQVYRARINGDATAMRLKSDLEKGS